MEYVEDKNPPVTDDTPNAYDNFNMDNLTKDLKQEQPNNISLITEKNLNTLTKSEVMILSNKDITDVLQNSLVSFTLDSFGQLFSNESLRSELSETINNTVKNVPGLDVFNIEAAGTSFSSDQTFHVSVYETLFTLLDRLLDGVNRRPFYEYMKVEGLILTPAEWVSRLYYIDASAFEEIMKEDIDRVMPNIISSTTTHVNNEKLTEAFEILQIFRNMSYVQFSRIIHTYMTVGKNKKLKYAISGGYMSRPDFPGLLTYRVHLSRYNGDVDKEILKDLNLSIVFNDIMFNRFEEIRAIALYRYMHLCSDILMTYISARVPNLRFKIPMLKENAYGEMLSDHKVQKYLENKNYSNESYFSLSSISLLFEKFSLFMQRVYKVIQERVIAPIVEKMKTLINIIITNIEVNVQSLNIKMEDVYSYLNTNKFQIKEILHRCFKIIAQLLLIFIVSKIIIVFFPNVSYLMGFADFFKKFKFRLLLAQVTVIFELLYSLWSGPKEEGVTNASGGFEFKTKSTLDAIRDSLTVIEGVVTTTMSTYFFFITANVAFHTFLKSSMGERIIDRVKGLNIKVTTEAERANYERGMQERREYLENQYQYTERREFTAQNAEIMSQEAPAAKIDSALMIGKLFTPKELIKFSLLQIDKKQEYLNSILAQKNELQKVLQGSHLLPSVDDRGKINFGIKV